MNPVYIDSKKQYDKNKKICNNYQKGLCGFCKNCNKLSTLHKDDFIDNSWVVLKSNINRVNQVQ